MVFGLVGVAFLVVVVVVTSQRAKVRFVGVEGGEAVVCAGVRRLRQRQRRRANSIEEGNEARWATETKIGSKRGRRGNEGNLSCKKGTRERRG